MWWKKMLLRMMYSLIPRRILKLLYYYMDLQRVYFISSLPYKWFVKILSQATDVCFHFFPKLNAYSITWGRISTLWTDCWKFEYFVMSWNVESRGFCSLFEWLPQLSNGNGKRIKTRWRGNNSDSLFWFCLKYQQIILGINLR